MADNSGFRVARYLEELSGAVIGITVIWFIAAPFLAEGPNGETPGWFWFGLVLGIVMSVAFNLVARQVEAEAHRRA